MKPKPLAALNHLTVPFSLTNLLLIFAAPTGVPKRKKLRFYRSFTFSFSDGRQNNTLILRLKYRTLPAPDQTRPLRATHFKSPRTGSHGPGSPPLTSNRLKSGLGSSAAWQGMAGYPFPHGR